ncbi:GntR family transcriptional regulator [Agromyces sp. NPDC058110]|uniref:GntR family transcriptional regulator n=1 Tax=Agromyces sp. NPDC058110 TaxID=3346345 RepID=UPI0036DEAAF5
MKAGDRAYAALLDDIQRGELAPGTVLAEAEQAARLGVSRTPLREALGRLAADGLVVQQSPRIQAVATLGARDVRQLFEVRRALEETSARLAAANGDRAVFAAFAEEFALADPARPDPAQSDPAQPDPAQSDPAQSDPERAGAQPDTAAESTLDAYYALIARFDAALDVAAANEHLAQALRVVRAHLGRVRRLARENPARLAASASEHRLIASAIAEGNTDLAAHATHVHLHNALANILASLPDAETDRPRRAAKGHR